jgi:hypothetical protein
MSWRIRGSYFEACNCDPICPCRRVDGVAGGRSTHGVCMGVLSWLVEDGMIESIDVSGLAVALATYYSDDEPGSPWTWIMYVEEVASSEQLAQLEAVYTGRLGGDAERHFPWAWKPSHLLAVRPAEISLGHSSRRQWLRVRDVVTVRIRDRYPSASTVTCVIPGHGQTGEELVAEELRVADEGLAFEFHEVCGYGSTFDYSG